MAENPEEQTPRGVRALLRGWRLWLLVAIVVYTLAGFLLAPWLIQRQIVSFGDTRLNRPLTVERVSVNPYSLTLTLEGLELDETDGKPIASLGQLFVNFQASSLFHWAWTFRDLRLGDPYLNFVRYEDGGTNLGRLADTLAATAEPEPAPPEPAQGSNGPVRLILENFLLDGGQVDVADLSRETDFSTHFGPIRLELFSLSTLPNHEAGHSFRVVTETGAEVVWKGQLQANPFRLQGHLEAHGERPRLIWRYIQDDVSFEVADGEVFLAADLDVSAHDGPVDVSVDNIEYTLNNLLLRPKGVEQDVLLVPKVAITGGRLRLREKTFHVEEARIEGARLAAFRDEAGVVNVVELLRPAGPPDSESSAGGSSGGPTGGSPDEVAPVGDDAPSSATGAESSTSELSGDTAPTPAAPAVATGVAAPGEPKSSVPEPDSAPVAEGADEAAAGGRAGTAGAEESSAESRHDWVFTLATLVIEDLGAEFEDRAWSQPIRTGVDDLNLTVSDFSTEPGSTFQVKLDSAITSGGQLYAEGAVALEPQSAEVELDLQSLNLDPLETMIADQVNLRLLSGALSVNGKVTHDADETLSFAGSAAVDELVTEDTILDERFVAWKRLSMPSIRFALDGGSLAIDTVEFDAPYGKLTVKADGTTNINDVFAPSGTSGEVAEPAAPTAETDDSTPFTVDINTVTISEGSANFADLSLPLPFATAIHSMKGEISNIGSENRGPATVSIAGVVDESGSADIDGELDPFAPTDFLKMDVLFRNVHMPRLTPYSAKFAGREIESGKLSLDLKYRIEQGKLDSTNKFVIDRIKLGKKVDSPEAMNLPLDLAIALLQDSNGQIDLDLPVTGDLNDPEFHYGPVVWKAFVGILVKAVTAPFKLLGALIPGGGKGEQLEFIEFEPGSAELSPTETADLETIAQAIGKRPQLLLKVPAAYSATTDKQALQAQKLQRKVDGRLPNTKPRDDATPERIAMEDIYIEEFSKTELDNLKAANTRATEDTGGKPQLDEEAYVAALTRSLREDETVDTAELASLATARGQAITDYLVNTAGVAQEQLRQTDVTTVEPTADGRIQLKFEVGSGGPGAPSTADPTERSSKSDTTPASAD